jgi:hypothetical protein
MEINRCAAGCNDCQGMSRREFVAATSAAFVSASLVGGLSGTAVAAEAFKPCGPASKCVPAVKACFVRRKGEYGIRWPGQVYDGQAALEKYQAQITATAKELNLKLDLRPQPLFNAEEADAWIAAAAAAKPDGLLVVLLDRQEHAWPTANKAIDTKIPTVVFSPVGTSFTVNTTEPSKKPNCFICSTDDFGQVRYGLKMLQAGTKMKATRCLVIKGKTTGDSEMPQLGIKLRQIPAKTFLEEYEKTPVSDEVLALAKDLAGRATGLRQATEQDVINGIKSYVVARTLMVREEADGITMDCLGALGKTKVSLPCIAWSKMNDVGIPAACEADLRAMATHVVVQYLFDRPGFQQDPVGETSREALLGAHCSCPTRLGGFSAAPEPFDIVHHHGQRDATARTVWKVGQRVTCAHVQPGDAETPAKMIVSAGEVIENVAVPPSGGCVISVMLKLDGVTDVLAYPGFHQLFFYGDFKRELVQFCRLYNIEPVVV